MTHRFRLEHEMDADGVTFVVTSPDLEGMRATGTTEIGAVLSALDQMREHLTCHGNSNVQVSAIDLVEADHDERFDAEMARIRQSIRSGARRAPSRFRL